MTGDLITYKGDDITQFITTTDDKLHAVVDNYQYQITVMGMKLDELKAHFNEVEKSYYNSVNEQKCLLNELKKTLNDYFEQEKHMNIFKRLLMCVHGKSASKRLAFKIQQCILKFK